MKPKLPPHDLENGSVSTDQGYIPYEYAERVAICMESGLSLREAQRVAAADHRRRVHGKLSPARASSAEQRGEPDQDRPASEDEQRNDGSQSSGG